MTMEQEQTKRHLERDTSRSVFAKEREKVWGYCFDVEVEVHSMLGGVPSDPNVRRGWLMQRLSPEGERNNAKDQRLLELIEKAVAEGKTADEAADSLSVNGFVRDANGGLNFEGRCVKAGIKESFSIALGGGHLKARGWGATNKGLSGFVAEHIQIPVDLVPLYQADGVTQYTQPDGIEQRFVSTFRGQSISYSERLDLAVMKFLVLSDWDFGDNWATIWALGEENGIGSMRSQGAGRFIVTKWEPRKPVKSTVVERPI
jgi:hypothetical protein